MADDKPYVLVQVGRSPSSRRRTVSINDRLVELMVSVYATDGALNAMLRALGIIGDDEYVLQFGPLRDGKPVNVPAPAPGAFALAEGAPPGPSPLEVLERRVSVLEAQSGTAARDKLLASQLRNLADHGSVVELADRNHLRAIATALDG